MTFIVEKFYFVLNIGIKALRVFIEFANAKIKRLT